MRAAILAATLLAAAPATAETLHVYNGNCAHHFTVEIADTPKSRELGLMFRKELAPTRGMLFVWPDSAPRAMWMKNTFIPLDMLFITKSGRIAYIAPMRQPHSLRSIHSQEPVNAVLELAGGTAARLMIRTGDRVSSPALGNIKPAASRPQCTQKQPENTSDKIKT